MKPKTARRRLRRNQWKMAKASVYATVRSYSGIGRKWKYWTKEALKG
jgi:hypothetical protein